MTIVAIQTHLDAVIESAKAERRRFQKPLLQALYLMVYGDETGQTLSRAEAAERVGMTDHGMYIALRKAHVKSALNAMKRDFREGAGWAGYRHMVHLMTSATSEHVQRQAAEFVAKDAGYGAERHEHHVSGKIEHQVSGYVLDLRPDGERLPDGQGPMIEGTAEVREPVPPELGGNAMDQVPVKAKGTPQS